MSTAAAIPREFRVSELSPKEYARKTIVSIVTDLTALTGNPRISRYPTAKRTSKIFLKLHPLFYRRSCNYLCLSYSRQKLSIINQ